MQGLVHPNVVRDVIWILVRILGDRYRGMIRFHGCQRLLNQDKIGLYRSRVVSLVVCM